MLCLVSREKNFLTGKKGKIKENNSENFPPENFPLTTLMKSDSELGAILKSSGQKLK
jgi:hypothetical protein